MVKIPSSTRAAGAVVVGNVEGGRAESELHATATAVSPVSASDMANSDDARGMGGIVEVTVGSADRIAEGLPGIAFDLA
jgi:hypothetical protein